MPKEIGFDFSLYAQRYGPSLERSNRFQKWLEVELAATETLAEAGPVPKDAAANIRERAKVDVAAHSRTRSQRKA